MIRCDAQTKQLLLHLKREHGDTSMDAVLRRLLGEAAVDEEAEGGSAEEESASEDEDLRPFSFRWFELDLKAREYFCGLGEGAFDWLWNELKPQVRVRPRLPSLRVLFVLWCVIPGCGVALGANLALQCIGCALLS